MKWTIPWKRQHNKFSQEKFKKLNSTIFINVVKKKTPGPDVFIGNFYQDFKE